MDEGGGTVEEGREGGATQLETHKQPSRVTHRKSEQARAHGHTATLTEASVWSRDRPSAAGTSRHVTRVLVVASLFERLLRL